MAELGNFFHGDRIPLKKQVRAIVLCKSCYSSRGEPQKYQKGTNDHPKKQISKVKIEQTLEAWIASLYELDKIVPCNQKV